MYTTNRKPVYKEFCLIKRQVTMIKHSKIKTKKNPTAKQKNNTTKKKKFLFCIFWDAGSLSNLSTSDIPLIALLTKSVRSSKLH